MCNNRIVENFLKMYFFSSPFLRLKIATPVKLEKIDWAYYSLSVGVRTPLGEITISENVTSTNTNMEFATDDETVRYETFNSRDCRLRLWDRVVLEISEVNFGINTVMNLNTGEVKYDLQMTYFNNILKVDSDFLVQLKLVGLIDVE